MADFSFLNRPEILQHLREKHYDLLIIGGGITGAGIALDASSRGLRTALVEKNDFAFGTSSRSTKLIHGGLRYLKQLEFGLVKEVGSERAVVHNLAPHLVLPEKMLLPLSEKKGLGYWLTSIGLKLYDWLAGVKPEDQRKMLTKLQTLKAEPLLKKEEVNGGALYAEYRTDDARLTIEIVKRAAEHQADILNYAKVIDFTYERGVITGVVASDQRTGQSFAIQAKAVVSAAGPWVDELREINKSREGKSLHLTKGVHVVVAYDKLPVRQAIYFDVDDGRMIFAIPRGRVTYIGTTDTNYDDDKDNVMATAADAAYLITAVNATFPDANLSVADIESSWAGLRPLIHEDGKSASELSRKDEIFESPTGLISIAGGKLTGYRKMAERVVSLVVKKYFKDRAIKGCQTEKLKITHPAFSNINEVKQYIAEIHQQLKPFDFSETISFELVTTFGKNTEAILHHFSQRLQGEKPELSLLKAMAYFSVQHEMVVTLEDFFVRRTGLLYFDLPRVRRWNTEVADEFKSLLGWDETRKQQEVESIGRLAEALTSFNES
ncbi:MAG: glycerol-3-phosphate dehydrogenase/oxidase [Cyclobacteriaceae bacterium]|nr:glycerol-3-phosphate dehydrogenase/oxidase [Cyclobacteriaceae bacterium]